MKRSFTSPRLIVPLLLVLPIGYRATTWLQPAESNLEIDAEMSRTGRELFLHEWTPNDPLAGEGDGLGPVFNAASCVACHHQGGPGGGGPLENNVTTFTVRAAKPSDSTRQGVMHAFATADQFWETLDLVGIGLPAISQPPLNDLLPISMRGCVVGPRIRGPLGVDISQRNTPALFGANLIDAVPDRLIIANERKQRLKWGLTDSSSEEFPVGRALRLADGRPGKFGWKAQIATLSDFVRAACANELGLGNPSQPQPAPLPKTDYQPHGLDLTGEQCDQITSFVASLSRPIETLPESAQELARVNSGKELFHSTGCAECHTPDLGSITGIYSDLLLHRMGQTLVGGGSYGDPPPELPEFVSGEAPDASEWRTPPLWGVADSSPYLHDGRAETLEKAVQLHGGQGERSAQRFAKLEAFKRGNLFAFLKALRAPAESETSPHSLE